MTSGWTSFDVLEWEAVCSLPQSHPLAPPRATYLLLTKPSSLIKDWYLIRSYNQSGVCSVEGGSHALWRPCPHSTGFSSRQSTDWFRGLGWTLHFGVGRLLWEWGIFDAFTGCG